MTYENECLPSIGLFFITMAGVKYVIQERVFLLRRYYELNHDINCKNTLIEASQHITQFITWVENLNTQVQSVMHYKVVI